MLHAIYDCVYVFLDSHVKITRKYGSTVHVMSVCCIYSHIGNGYCVHCTVQVHVNRLYINTIISLSLACVYTHTQTYRHIVSISLLCCYLILLYKLFALSAALFLSTNFIYVLTYIFFSFQCSFFCIFLHTPFLVFRFFIILFSCVDFHCSLLFCFVWNHRGGAKTKWNETKLN